MTQTNSGAALGGTFTMPGMGRPVHRLGYGAMQLAGPGVWGPPRDPEEAVAVLREAVALGVDHIDTSDFYGPHTTNEVIRQALHPYPDHLTLVTKVGFLRGADKSWLPAASADQLRAAVESNLRTLGIEALDMVNLRVGSSHGPDDKSIAAPFTVLAELQQRGLVRHLGLSTVTAAQVAEAQAIAPVACVQNMYNLAQRGDDSLVDALAEQGIAYVPYFPLGGFTPLQSDVLTQVAARLGASPKQVALAWLLQRAPNILLIPGTSSVAHLRENIAAATLTLPPDAVDDLDDIGIAAAI